MSTQHNDSLSFAWLMPIFEKQLVPLTLMWQNYQEDSAESFDLEVAYNYHELAGAMEIANLPTFSNLARALSAITKHIAKHHSLQDNESFIIALQTAYSAHELLRAELKEYANSGNFHQHIVVSATKDILKFLPKDINISVQSLQTETNKNLSHILQMPSLASEKLQLSSEQKKKIIEAWNYHSKKLILENSNDSESIVQLFKMSQFIWRSCDGQLQKLWYLVDVWLNSLPQNDLPKPQQYQNIINQITDTLPKAFFIDLSQSKDFENVNNDSQVDCEKLIADIYVQISQLKKVSKDAQAIIAQPHKTDVEENKFFSKIMQQLEPLIFRLDEPESIIQPLRDIRSQLDRRGWETQVLNIDLVLNELQSNLNSKEAYEATRWQIERQLQEVYGAILLTRETIEQKIGFNTELEYMSEDDDIEEKVENDFNVTTDPAKLREVRIAIETIKTQFNQYAIKHDLSALPKNEVLESIKPAFVDMELGQANEVVDKLLAIFDKLSINGIQQTNWTIVGVIADSISEFELFLDYLAQQVLELDRLDSTKSRIDKADELLNEFMQGSNTVIIEAQPKKDTSVIRYADAGEIHPKVANESGLKEKLENNSETSTLEESFVTSSNENNLEDIPKDILLDKDTNRDIIQQTLSSEMPLKSLIPEVSSSESLELKKAREVLNDDDFSMDEDIREIFIEEAEEVLEEMDENLPQWEQDPQNQIILKEIRRGFHTLKGSGRMVGANNIGEMSWSVENMLNRLLDSSLEVNSEIIKFIEETKEKIPTLVQDFANQQAPSIDPAITVLQANNLLNGKDINTGLEIPILTHIEQTTDTVSSVSVENPVEELESAEKLWSLDSVESLESFDELETIEVTNSEVSNIVEEPALDSIEQIEAIGGLINSDIVELDVNDVVINDLNMTEEEFDLTLELKSDESSSNVDTQNEFDEWIMDGEEIALEINDDKLDFPSTTGSIDISPPSQEIEVIDSDEDGTSDIEAINDVDMLNDEKVVEEFDEINLEEVPETKKEEHLDLALKTTKPEETDEDLILSEMPLKSLIPEVSSSESLELKKAREVLNDDDFSMDKDIREIFIEEAEEVLEEMDENLPQWEQDPQNQIILKEIRRGFHTLKGSGRMVGANNIGEMSWSVENMLNRLLDSSLEVNSEIIKFIEETKEKIPTLVQDFSNQQAPSIDPAITVLQANNLLNGKDINTGLEIPILTNIEQTTDTVSSVSVENPVEELESVEDTLNFADEEVEEETETENILVDKSLNELIKSPDQIAAEIPLEEISESNTLLSSEVSIPQVLQPFWDESLNIPKDSLETDEDIQEIFIEEAQEVLETITPLHHQWSADTSDNDTLTEIRRGFHTLKGSGRMVGANQTAELAWSIENMFNRVLDGTIDVDEDILLLTEDVLSAYPDMIETYQTGTNEYPIQLNLWIASAHAYSKGKGGEFDYSSLMQAINSPTTVEPAIENEEEHLEIESELVTEDVEANQELSQPVETVIDEVELTYAETVVDVNLEDKNQKVSAQWTIAPVIVKSSITTHNKGLIFDEFHTIKNFEIDYEELGLGIFDNPENQPEVDEVCDTKNTEECIENSDSNEINEDEKVFIDIFIEEAKERLDVIDKFVAEHEGDNYIAVSNDLVRAFHTLRGASGAKALQLISEISDTMESHLAHLQHHEDHISEQQLQAIKQSSSLIADYISTYEQYGDSGIATEDCEQRVKLIHDLLIDTVAKDNDKKSSLSIDNLVIDDFHELLDAEWELEDNIGNNHEQTISYANTLAMQIQSLQSRTLNSNAFQTLLTPMSEIYQKIAECPELASNKATQMSLLLGHEQLLGLFDSLASNMSLEIDNEVVNALTTTLTDCVEDVGTDSDLIEEEPSSTDVQDIVDSSEEEYDEPSVENTSNESMLEDFIEETSIEAVDSQSEIIQSVIKQASVNFEEINTDDELLEIFLEEAQELETEITQSFSVWRQNPNDINALKELQRHLHTIKGGARMAGISSIGDLTHEMETIYEKFVNYEIQPSNKWLSIMQSAQDTLSMQIEYVSENKQSFYTPEIIEELLAYGKLEELPDNASLSQPVLSEQSVEIIEQEDEVETTQDDDYDEVAENFDKLVKDSWNGSEPDENILNVFLEEANEITESSNEHFEGFKSNTSDIANLQALQRELHTIKGGARMVGANGIADLSHEMESVYEDLGHRRLPSTKMVLQLLNTSHDWLVNSIYLLQNNINPPTPTVLIDALKTFHKNPDSLTEIPLISLEEYRTAINEFQVYQRSLRGDHDTSEMPPMVGDFGEFEEATDISSEMIRVPSGLMEQMINLSGESAINRARIDMGMSSLTISIEEMGTTVQRLADQLRRMEIELEAQIMAQIDDEDLLESEDFDPLEMDQYSSFNQLSKSLSESASDLLDIKSTLLDKTRDSESLLLQLSRTQNELQSGLMSSRMVPFSRLTPRLQRIVRQTANEVGKQVELSIVNADDEMDRTILERITSPLEHMLRNAVDHGVEHPDERVEMGKDRMGRISLSVIREGGEMVIQLSDDGAGINVDSVRNKAIKQGLIDENDESLTDTDIMQYIFNAGLSTTNKVTQISGRGVGMDVVRSEIRQLGGTVAVESLKGRGSTFTMRVPLTVAVSDALIVRAADRQYAIPLVQIERVEQVSSEELYLFYQSSERTFNISDIDYRLRYLNEILTGTTVNDLSSVGNSTLPVILIKNQTGQNLALQVDEIVGSRIEVVVKPLGKQLSHVSGVSAATIMGDGSVMMILDLMALVRNAPVRKISSASPHSSADVRKKILVIDDSVTVRKVTSRFLEREGFDVHVAKDGVDAIEVLQEFTPDLMLLDIEMPRMDGFEVATRVRRTDRLKEIPIIMITSRTGDKHRERAMEIGVNDYLGKPFQENVLIERIGQLIDVKMAKKDDG